MLHAVQRGIWVLFALWPRKTKENLDGVGHWV
jgi:hypothetical protein